MKNILLIGLLACFIYAPAQNVVSPMDSIVVDTTEMPASVDTTLSQKPDTSSVNSESTRSQKSNHKGVYHLNPWTDIPITAATAGWSAYAFTHIYSKSPSTIAEIEALDKNDVPKIDRWAAGMHDENADANSNYLFYGSIPVPFFLLIDKSIRKETGKVLFMYLEAMSITGLFYTGSVYFVDRYRPETYDTSIPAEERTSGNYKDAFLAGHPALVATGLFFTAKVYSDYHRGSTLSYALYGLAIAGTGATAYLRHIAGKHFPTDLLCGVTVGTLSGILVPQFHKYCDKKNSNMSMAPLIDGKIKGISFAYRF